MAVLASGLFSSLANNQKLFTSCKNDFNQSNESASELRDRTIAQLDERGGVLSQDNLEAKIQAFEGFILKITTCLQRLEEINRQSRVHECLGISKDAVMRVVVYGFSGIGACIGAFNDFSSEIVDECSVPVWLKLYRASATVVILPFIFAMEVNFNKKEELRANVISHISIIDRKLKSIRIFKAYLEHRKEAVEVQSGVSSPDNDRKLAKVLRDMHHFTHLPDVHQKESSYHLSMVQLAQQRVSASGQGVNPRLRVALDELDDEGAPETTVQKLCALERFRGAARSVSDTARRIREDPIRLVELQGFLGDSRLDPRQADS